MNSGLLVGIMWLLQLETNGYSRKISHRKKKEVTGGTGKPMVTMKGGRIGSPRVKKSLGEKSGEKEERKEKRREKERKIRVSC